jgi:hypothetical protein
MSLARRTVRASSMASTTPGDPARRQLGEVRRHAARLVPGEQLGRRAPTGLVLEIEIAERLPGAVADNEAGVVRLLDRPGPAESGGLPSGPIFFCLSPHRWRGGILGQATPEIGSVSFKLRHYPEITGADLGGSAPIIAAPQPRGKRSAHDEYHENKSLSRRAAQARAHAGGESDFKRPPSD